MKVFVVGDSGGAGSLADELAARDVAVTLHADGSPSRGGFEEIDAIASQLRELEGALGKGNPDAVVVASDSAAALAAVLVATKLGIPVARLDGRGANSGATNSRLVGQLADAALAREPGAILDWIGDAYTERA